MSKNRLEKGHINSPVVTIGIPTFNRAELLKEAIESVLQQTYRNIKIIVSDNGSEDHTYRIVEDLKKKSDDIQIHYTKFDTTVSVFENWLKVLELADSPYFGWLQDDDLIRSDFIEHAVASLLETHEATVYCCYAQYNDEPVLKNSMTLWGPPFQLNWGQSQKLVLNGSDLIPFGLYDTLGYSPVAIYDRESLNRAKDLVRSDYWLYSERIILIKASLGHKIILDSRIGGLFRSHGEQRSLKYNSSETNRQQYQLFVHDLLKMYDQEGDRIFANFAENLKLVDLAKKVAWRIDAIASKEENRLTQRSFEILSDHIDSEKQRNPTFFIKLRVQKAKNIILKPYHYIVKQLMKLR